jgi:membrane-associated phospholipid phosphatase
VETTRQPSIAAGRHLLAVVPVALLGALYVVAVGTAFGRRMDVDAVQAFPDGGRLEGLAEAVMQPVNAASAATAALVLTLLAFRRGGAPAAITVAALIAASSISARALKLSLGALDPLGGEHDRALGPAYFPSGHATAVMSIVLAAAIALAPARLPARAGVVLAWLAGLAIVSDRSHHVSDVLAGYLLAAAWAAAAASFLPAHRRADVAVASAPDRALWISIGVLALPAVALSSAAATAALLMLACAAAAPLALHAACRSG